MAGTGRTTAIASALLLALLWGGGGSAATVIAGPGTPETLIHDVHLTVASSRAVRRSVPPPPARADLLETATVIAARAGCVAAGTSAASAVGSSVGYLWVAARCLHRRDRPDADPVAAFAIAHLFLPPPPAPFWSARGAPVQLPRPGGGIGPRPQVAPVPLPPPGMALLAAFGLLLFGRRRR